LVVEFVPVRQVEHGLLSVGSRLPPR
jgi:hypothetical protein